MKCLAVACMVFILAGAPMAQESPVIEHLGDSGNAWINWERQVIKAVGVGVLPGDAPSPQEAERLARQAAGINAYRNIESAIRMARVHGETLVGNIIPEVPEIRLKQLAHSAEVISDRQRYDRSFEVILQVPLAGVRGVLPESVGSDGSDTSNTINTIDARQEEIWPALMPRVFDDGGNLLYCGPAKYTATWVDGLKAWDTKDSTDIVLAVAGLTISEGRLTILIGPIREPDKPTPAPSPNRG